MNLQIYPVIIVSILGISDTQKCVSFQTLIAIVIICSIHTIQANGPVVFFVYYQINLGRPIKCLGNMSKICSFIQYTLFSSAGKESACNAGDLGSIPGLRRSPGEGNGYHSSILAWRIPWTVQSVELQSWTQLSDFHTHTHCV